MPVKAGIIGAGGIASYHIRGYKTAGAEVVAVCDTDVARAQATAKENGIARTYSSPEEMFAAEKTLTAVSICTPNKFHAPVALAAAKAVKHIFCEKPPALTVAEAKQMAEAAKSAGVYLMFDFNNRARPESLAMKRYIDDGVVGKINSAQAAWVRRCGIPGYGGWFTQKALSGGGPTIDLLHMLDLALWFMGYPEPAWVSGNVFTDFAHDSTFAGPWGLPKIKGGTMDVETSAQALITFKTGQVLFTRMSWAEMVEREEVSVAFQGTKAGGRVCRLFGNDGLDDTAQDACQLYTHDNGVPANRDVLVRPDPSMGRINAVVNFVQTIDGSAKPLSTADEGVKLMKIIQAIYQTATSGAPVDVTKL
jgi:predicted dehydrogenase